MNPRRENIINTLKKSERKLWRAVAKNLEKKFREVNLSRLNKVTKSGDIVIVPGKVLGTGEIHHSITIGAFSYTNSALEKLKKSKS